MSQIMEKPSATVNQNALILDHNDSQLVLNPACQAGAYPQDLRNLLAAANAAQAGPVIKALPAYTPTPLRNLADIAGQSRLAQVHYKDEGLRFAEAGLKSFKGLGAVYALYEHLADRIASKTGSKPPVAALLAGSFREMTCEITVTCATDGNFGRAVAWAASQFGCKAVIFISTSVSLGREQAIAAYGAEVRRVPFVYEDAVRAADLTARASGWTVISDTAYPGCEALPKLVTQGYTVMVEEALAQWPHKGPPSHVFLQCGVGGMASAIAGMLWDIYGKARPVTVIVEPNTADCGFRSVEAGEMRSASGNLDTICAGLSCGELSTHAWTILSCAAHAAMVLPDGASAAAMRFMARRKNGIVAGESAVIGLAALTIAAAHQPWRSALGLNEKSKVLLFGTEGDTDPVLYRSIINGADA